MLKRSGQHGLAAPQRNEASGDKRARGIGGWERRTRSAFAPASSSPLHFPDGDTGVVRSWAVHASWRRVYGLDSAGRGPRGEPDAAPPLVLITGNLCRLTHSDNRQWRDPLSRSSSCRRACLHGPQGVDHHRLSRLKRTAPMEGSI